MNRPSTNMSLHMTLLVTPQFSTEDRALAVMLQWNAFQNFYVSNLPFILRFKR